MRPPGAAVTPDQFDAVLFDLDGVLTDTARVHAICWKTMFDEFLRDYSLKHGKTFAPFDIDTDYAQHVDGKLRYDGVRGFLESRQMQLPYGDPDAPPNDETICGLGNRKDELVGEVLASQGVEAYEGSLAWVRHLRSQGMRTAVVSASRNCRSVLETAGIADLFDVRVDGEVADRLRLAGKPAPDTFLEAARELGIVPERAVIVEDAIAGVQAGRAGGFGLVIGVARKGNRTALAEGGADVVVGDPSELLK
jgi:beta-phosphoglucomutase family hydrolase